MDQLGRPALVPRALPSTKRRKPSDYDPEVAAAEAEKRNSAARAFAQPDAEGYNKLESKWKRGPRNIGAMIRTNTHNPKVAVAREKIAQLRKRRKNDSA